MGNPVKPRLVLLALPLLLAACAGKPDAPVAADPVAPRPAREQEPDAADAVELAAPQGEVTFEHVDFSYVPVRKLLQDICIEAKPGKRFALVGPTGCGKTTLINLLLRFYDIDAGRIMVDGGGRAYGGDQRRYYVTFDRCLSTQR